MIKTSRLSNDKQVSMTFTRLLVFLTLGTWTCFLGGKSVAEGHSAVVRRKRPFATSRYVDAKIFFMEHPDGKKGVNVASRNGDVTGKPNRGQYVKLHKNTKANSLRVLMITKVEVNRKGNVLGPETAACLQELQQQLIAHGWVQKVSSGGRSNAFNRMCYARVAPCAYLVGAKQLEGLMSHIDHIKGSDIEHVLVVFSDKEGLFKAKRIVIEGKKIHPSLNFLGLLQATNCKAVEYATRLHEYLTGFKHHVLVRRNVGNDVVSKSSNILHASTISEQVEVHSSAILNSKPGAMSVTTTSESAVEKSAVNVAGSSSRELIASPSYQSMSVTVEMSHATRIQKESPFVDSAQLTSPSISVDTNSPRMSAVRTSVFFFSSPPPSKSVGEGSKVTPQFSRSKSAAIGSKLDVSMAGSVVKSSSQVEATEIMTSTVIVVSRSEVAKARTTSINYMQTTIQTAVKSASSQVRLSQVLSSHASQMLGSHSLEVLPSESSVLSIRRTPSISQSSYSAAKASHLETMSLAMSHSVSILTRMTSSESLTLLSGAASASLSISASSSPPVTILGTAVSLSKATSPSPRMSQLQASITLSLTPTLQSLAPSTQGILSTSSLFSSASPFPSPSPTRPPSARYQVKLDGNCSFLGNASFKQELKTKIKSKVASSLGVDDDLVTVEDVTCGSIIVIFRVTNPTANTEDVLRSTFTKNYTVQVGAEQLKGVKFEVLKASSTTVIAQVTTTRRSVISTSTTLKPTPSAKPTEKPKKKNEDAMILYIAIGCVAGFILLVIIVVAIRGCRQRASKGALTINDKADFELGHFESIPRAKVKMYGAERESRTNSFDAPYSGYTDAPVNTQLRLQDENNLSGSRDNLIGTSGKLRGIDNPALSYDSKEEK